MSKKLLVVVNSADFFLSHRLPIALAAKQAGYEVHLATSGGDSVKRITELGLFHHAVPLTRSGRNPVREWRAAISLFRLMRQIKPSLVHLVTIKPVLFGGLAARLAGVPAAVAAVSGLGTVFLARGKVAQLVRWCVGILYRLALGHKNMAVIFQNPDDRDALMGIGAVRWAQVRIIRGSGVDLASCPCRPEPNGMPVVTMAARLLRDKGVEEFVEAARLVKAQGLAVRFQLIGSPDPGNPTSITADELARWKEEGVLELPGYRDDIPEQYASSHIVCLPSYREGLPKSLVEAAACGRAVVTTDVPGCRDAIEPGNTGVLVPVRNAQALANAIQDLVENPHRRRALGIAGRELAEQAFAIEKIVGAHLAIYRELEASS